MYRNTNQECVRELGRENYKSHKGRNRMAILAIILTTMLISVTFTAGFSIYQTIDTAENAAPGPGSDSNGFYGSFENVVKARELPQVEWAAYAGRCSTRMIQNKEFSGLQVRLFAPDEVHYDKNMVEPISGAYPKEANELLVSDSFAKRFGITEENDKYSLIVAIEEKGESVEKEISFRVCGIYKNPLQNVSGYYEELYTSEKFITVYNPELPQGFDSIYIKLNNLDFWQFGHDKEGKIEEVNAAAGGNGTFYKMSDTSALTLIPVFLLVIIIMLCGYFFIYNVFYISIVNDIRFYGELKTIGMTSVQLRKMLFGQMNRLSIWGIGIGCVAGYLIGILVAKGLIPSFMDNIAGYYQPAGALAVFAATIVFGWLTVYISTMKPFRMAETISPIEAARYRGSGKKGIFTVVSFFLAGLLFLGVYTLTMGYDIESMVERYNQADFRIWHHAFRWTMDEPYKAFPQELIRQIEALDVTEEHLFYRARTKPDYYEFGNRVFYEESQGEIKAEGELAMDIRVYNDAKDPGSYGIIEENERGNYRLTIGGMPAETLDAEAQYLEILEGELNQEAFATGNYLIYQRSRGSVETGLRKDWEKSEQILHPGDEAVIYFYDDLKDRYIEKTLTVMAIIDGTDMFGTGNISNNHLIIADQVFQDIYSDSANLAAVMQFNLKNGREKAQYEQVKSLVEQYGHLQLLFDSKYKEEMDQARKKNIMTIIGLFLSGLVGMIGISNVVNTVATDVLARKIEFAAMQSIGMTKKQMQKMIFLQSIKYTYGSVLLSILLGAPLIHLLGQNTSFSGFSLPAFGQAAGILLVITALLCGGLSFVLTQQLNRLPVAERLREIV